MEPLWNTVSAKDGCGAGMAFVAAYSAAAVSIRMSIVIPKADVEKLVCRT